MEGRKGRVHLRQYNAQYINLSCASRILKSQFNSFNFYCETNMDKITHNPKF